MTFAAVALVTTLLSPAAMAGRAPMESLNRVHGGLAITDNGSGVGVIGGLDSRLTRLVFVDIGGFFTPGQQMFDPSIDPETSKPEEWYTLRNGLYAAPGLRIPHRYQEGFNWDFVGRLGFAAVWVSDKSQHIIPQETALVYSEAAVLGGADVLLRYNDVGLRLAGKAFAWNKFSPVARMASATVRPQFTIEGVYQF